MDDQARVVFMPSGKRATVKKGRTILDVARELGVDLDSVCGGRQRCGRCQVTVGEGQFAKLGLESSAQHLSEWQGGEQRLVSMGRLKKGRRLGCTARIEGDLVIDVPAESQVHRQVVRKDASTRFVDIDPLVRLYQVDVDAPDLHKRGSHLTRLEAALDEQWGIGVIAFPPQVLAQLDWALSKGKGHITLAIRQGNRVVGVWPDVITEIYGFAVDIGTTTIVAHLCSLISGEIKASKGAMNPQIRFGEDLMSRVSYVQMNPGSLPDMVSLLRESVGAICEEAMSEAEIASDKVLEIVLVGNPIMHHFLHGFDPTPLGLSPFPLVTDKALSRPVSDFALPLAKGGMVYTLPCIAGHVGADAAGVALSEAPYKSSDISLIIDIGTNAEIIFGNKDRLLACSSPTGPAFEGAQISSGQRAAPGAIERFRVDPETLEPRYKVIGCELWSDEEGFAEGTKATGVSGICGSGIIEAVVELYRAGVISSDGLLGGSEKLTGKRIKRDGETYSYIVRFADEGAAEMLITQLDIRNIQLAKAAVYAGARILMEKFGCEAVDRVVLAGAFGSYIDPIYAMGLGLIPDCPAEKVFAAGNAAGTGAQMALLNKASREEIEYLAERIEKIETAVESRFQSHFIEAMGLPHRSDSFPNLQTVLPMPLHEGQGRQAGRQRRRHRERVQISEAGV